jgi:ketosteroid isomerase-like protein
MPDEGPTDPRVDAVLRLLAAYSRGDVAAMQEDMSLGVVLEAVGDNPLAGTYTGLGSVMAFVARSMATFLPESVAVDEVTATEDEVRVVVRGLMGLVDGGTASVRVLQRYVFGPDGKAVRVRAEAADDQREFDRLLTQQARRQ